MQNELSKKQLEFILAMEQFGNETGTPPSLSKVVGLLLICEPSYQSAIQIQRAVGLSAGSVNNALNLLRYAKLITRRVLPGDRHHYYEFDTTSWRKLVFRQLEAMSKGVNLAEKGLVIYPDNSRLLAMRDFYVAYASAVDDIKARFQ